MKFKFGYYILFTNDIIDVHEGCQGINEQLPKGLKSYPRQFSRFLYYKNLPIMHFFGSMHIRKNVIETLCKIFDGRCDKEKLVKIYNDVDEFNHALNFFLESNSNRNWINMRIIHWLLMPQKTDAIYEAIKKN